MELSALIASRSADYAHVAVMLIFTFLAIAGTWAHVQRVNGKDRS